MCEADPFKVFHYDGREVVVIADAADFYGAQEWAVALDYDQENAVKLGTIKIAEAVDGVILYAAIPEGFPADPQLHVSHNLAAESLYRWAKTVGRTEPHNIARMAPTPDESLNGHLRDIAL